MMPQNWPSMQLGGLDFRLRRITKAQFSSAATVTSQIGDTPSHTALLFHSNVLPRPSPFTLYRSPAFSLTDRVPVSVSLLRRPTVWGGEGLIHHRAGRLEDPAGPAQV